jgi:tripartite motif-containing protein 71
VATWTLTASPTITDTPGPSPTATSTLTPTVTATPTPFGWLTPTASPTISPTRTLTVTPSPSPTISADGYPYQDRTGRDQFSGPRAIAVAADGSIYVADTRNHRVKRLASDGAVVSVWGADGGTSTRAGTAPGEFSDPAGIAVDAAGNVLVSEYGNHRIQKFTADGTPLAQWGSYGTAPGQFAHPRGIAVASTGEVYVADTNNLRVQVLSAAGAPVAAHDLQFWPEGVLPLGNGSFAATAFYGGAGIGCAARINPGPGGSSQSAAWSLSAGLGYQLNFCAGIGADTDGSLLATSRWWVPNASSDGSSLLRIDTSTGVVAHPFTAGASTCVLETTSWSNDRCVPRGVAVEPSGTILVTDVGRNKVVRLARDGTVLATWG